MIIPGKLYITDRLIGSADGLRIVEPDRILVALPYDSAGNEVNGAISPPQVGKLRFLTQEGDVVALFAASTAKLREIL